MNLTFLKVAATQIGLICAVDLSMMSFCIAPDLGARALYDGMAILRDREQKQS